jgi:hypothetical protein
MVIMVMAPTSAVAKPLKIILDKTSIIKINRNAAVVLVAQPEIASVSVESQRLIFIIGKTTGETNLVILDSNGDEIVNYDLIVTPETERHVTVHGGTDATKTLSCAPRCTDVKSPGPAKSSGGAAGGAAGGGGTGAALKKAVSKK